VEVYGERKWHIISHSRLWSLGKVRVLGRAPTKNKFEHYSFYNCRTSSRWYSEYVKIKFFCLFQKYPVFELPGGRGFSSLNCFLNPPPNTMSNYARGSQLYTVCIRFTSQFWSTSNHREVRPPPPANFSQFKHWKHQDVVFWSACTLYSIISNYTVCSTLQLVKNGI